MPYFIKNNSGTIFREMNPDKYEKPVRENNSGNHAKPIMGFNPGNSGISGVQPPEFPEAPEGFRDVPGNTPGIAPEYPGNSSGIFEVRSGSIPDIPGYLGNTKKSEVDHA